MESRAKAKTAGLESEDSSRTSSWFYWGSFDNSRATGSPAKPLVPVTEMRRGADDCAVPDLPSGTVTFLFTDIEGSTRLLRELGDRYVEALAEHQQALREAFAANDGVEVA